MSHGEILSVVRNQPERPNDCRDCYKIRCPWFAPILGTGEYALLRISNKPDETALLCLLVENSSVIRHCDKFRYTSSLATHTSIEIGFLLLIPSKRNYRFSKDKVRMLNSRMSIRVKLDIMEVS